MGHLYIECRDLVPALLRGQDFIRFLNAELRAGLAFCSDRPTLTAMGAFVKFDGAPYAKFRSSRRDALYREVWWFSYGGC